MHLSLLQIRSFRGIEQLDVPFHKGVNVLIGENGTCKTAIIDALRLCLSFASERREVFVQADDFFTPLVGAAKSPIQFDLTFDEVDATQQGVFLEMLDLSEARKPVLRLHVRFELQDDHVRRSIWGGANEGQDVPYPELQLLYSVYLGPLRDATRDLAPSRANRLSQLFLNLVPKEGRQKYADEINQQLRSAAAWQKLLESGETKIEQHLREITLSGDPTKIDVEFVDATFKDIAEGLRLYIPRAASPSEVAGVAAVATVGVSTAEVVPLIPETATQANRPARFSVAQSSLGFNNLLYIATVFGDLLERAALRPYAYAALFLEEPEAHLHPQWQNRLFQYLQTLYTKAHAQIFITSHSPTITAKCDPDWLVAMGREGGALAATPVRRCGLSEESKKYLQRFLDVTKSQLFYARAVILVEGLSEALLLPTLALALGTDYDLQKCGVEVVNVGGVAFAPFASLFNSTDAQSRLPMRCALITDDDRTEAGVSSRALNAQALHGGLLRVFLGRVTFEYEMYLANETVLLDAYRSMHKDTDLAFPGALGDRAHVFLKKLKGNKDKAILAQHLAATAVPSGTVSVTAPGYIAKAITWVVKGEEPK